MSGHVYKGLMFHFTDCPGVRTKGIFYGVAILFCVSVINTIIFIIVTSVPSEITKLGNKAVEIYRQALNEGKEKIPYCSMLILGREEVGKTSFFRQLLGKPYLKDMERTQGIDNSTVGTFERRNVDIGQWVMKENGDQSKQFGDALAGEFFVRMPRGLSKEDKNDIVSESDLQSQFEKINIMSPVLPQQSRESDNNIIMSKQRPVPGTEHSIVARTTRVNPQLTLTSSAPPKQSDSIPAILNPRESAKLNETVMRAQSYVRKEPEPCLNVKDFAGQVVYRPMHHCYINRNAIYVVVFKIPDMMEYIHDSSHLKYNPLDDICYWIRSIHAHTYSSSNKTARRVLLVGTYRDTLPNIEANIREIDGFIENNLVNDKKRPYIKYVYPMYDSPSACRFIIPVENSIDIVSNPETYLQESGTKYVQDTVKEIAKSLPQFNEQYPIKWLKFEEYLQEQCEARKSTPVMKIEEAKQLAVKSGITNEQQQELALQFFNDTGKLNCLSKRMFDIILVIIIIRNCRVSPSFISKR